MASDGSGEVTVVAVVDEATAEKLDEAAADVLVLPLVAPTDGDNPLGVMGRPFDRRAPFFVGLMGALGVAVAYVIAIGIGDIASVLVLIWLALFIAIGLNPIVALLVRHGLSRGTSVGVVTLGFVLLILASCSPPLAPSRIKCKTSSPTIPGTGPTSQRARVGPGSW